MNRRNGRKAIVTKEDGSIIRPKNMCECAEITGVSKDVITRICSSGSKEKINGYSFKFSEDDWRKPLAPRAHSSPRKRYGIKRGHAYTRWKSQKQRCENPKLRAYKTYGAVGISVEYTAKEFMDWFEVATLNIKEEDIMLYDVGRIDHSKNYRIDNIEIQTKTDNTKERNSRIGNPRKPIPVLIFDKQTQESTATKSILDASKVTGIHDAHISKFIRSSKEHDRYKFYRYGEVV